MSRLRTRLKDALLRRWQVPYSPMAGLAPSAYLHARGGRELTVLDIGAHRGDFVRAIAQIATIRQALLLEPLPHLAQALRDDEELLRYDIEECAVGDHDGEVEINYFPNAPYISSALKLDLSIAGMPEIARGEPMQIKCRIRSVDSILRGKTGYAHIDLMKIDVQGLEHMVIGGAAETLDRVDAVCCEVSFRPVYAGSSTFFDIYELLKRRGFVLSSIDPGHRAPNGELLQGDAFFLRARGVASGT